jgi:hypothetical protein
MVGFYPYIVVVIPSFDSPREGIFATSKLMPLDDRLIFSNLLKVYFLSYSEFGFTTSTSKLATNGTPMVVTIVWGLVKCKLQVAL